MTTDRAGPLHAAIVGAGLMGAWHARAARRAGAHLAAVVDSDLARARALAQRFPGCVAISSLEQLPITTTLEVVHICTPSSTHEALTRESLARGSHVLVEKPLAPSAQLTSELLYLAVDARLFVCPVHQLLFQRGVRQVLARMSELGELLHIRSLACSAGAAGKSPAAADRISLEILPHPLSLIERFVPGTLRRLRWLAVHPQPGELQVMANNGPLSVNLTVSMHGRPTTNEVTLVGTRATVHLDLFHGFALFESGGVSQGKKIRRPFDRGLAEFVSASSNLVWRAFKRQPAYPGLWELIDGFYRAIEGTAAPPMSASEIIAVAEALDSIRELLVPDSASSSEAYRSQVL